MYNRILTTRPTRFWGGATLLLYTLLLQSCQPYSVSTTEEAFGASSWQQYYGEVGELALPDGIEATLDAPCPFWPDKQVRDTHLLVLIPAKVDGKLFTLNLLGELIKSPKRGGNKTQYGYYAGAIQSQVGNEAPASSYWLLLTRDVLPESHSKTYTAQKALVAYHARRTGLNYELPKTLEAATAILTHHVRTGERLYNKDNEPWTYTRCQELIRYNSGDYPPVVGGFEPSGLDVEDYVHVYDYSPYGDGVAGCRKFEPLLSTLSDPFGASSWQQYYGEVGEEPALPADMETTLDAPCPFWESEGKKVRDTHLLVLIPAEIDGKPFTLNLLGELIKSPKGRGNKTKYRYCASTVQSQVGNEAPAGSYWVLLTRDVLPESRSKTYTAQKALVAGHASRTGLSYELPKTLEAATAILTHHARTGEHLYGNNPWTYTRCQELIRCKSKDVPSVVGGFGPSGLCTYVSSIRYDYDYIGVAGCRKFF